jgi:membrane protein DedA with SNARE-associated domain/membrane-associated phospholipid phosphatase
VSATQVIAALAALAVAVFVVRRWGRIGVERKVALVLLAVVLGVYATDLFPDLPDAKTVIVDVAQALGPYTYLLVGALAFLETGAFVGLVAPGETVVIAAGVIAGQGEISLLPLIGVVWTCAVLGDTTSFFIGRRLGRDFLLRHGPKVGITRPRLEQVEGYFQRHGGKTILIGRFIGLVRALAPFIAGSSRLAYRRFIPFSVVGTGLWATVFCLLGYLFWQSFDRVAQVAGQATFAFGVVAGVVVGAVYAYRRLRDEGERRRLQAWIERQSRKPALKPLFVVARPVWRGLLRPAWHALAPEVRFLWHRLTPGELGLELTTVLAVGGGGAYTFVLYADAVVDHPGPLGMDRAVSDLVDSWRPDAALDIARVVTDFGALTTVGTLVAVTAFALALQRRAIEPIALVTGLVLIVIGVHLAKAGIDRPRPEHTQFDTSGSGFPSGHAAYATAWPAVALVLTRVIPGLASRAGLIVVGVVVCAAVAGSRVYMGVHYTSDVLGGLGLGFALFGICATVGLVVAFIRHNGRSPEGAASRPEPAADRR